MSLPAGSLTQAMGNFTMFTGCSTTRYDNVVILIVSYFIQNVSIQKLHFYALSVIHSNMIYKLFSISVNCVMIISTLTH